MNVALTLAPVLSALAMFALLRRWVRWAPAAFVGGLVYGFSPFLVTELALNQLNIAFLAIPPLVVMALDELLVRQRRSPYAHRGGAGALLVRPVLREHRGAGHHRSVRGGRRGAHRRIRRPPSTRDDRSEARTTHCGGRSPRWSGRPCCPGLSGVVPAPGSRPPDRPDLVQRLALPVREHAHQLCGPSGVSVRFGTEMIRFGGYQGPGSPGSATWGWAWSVVAVVGCRHLAPRPPAAPVRRCRGGRRRALARPGARLLGAVAGAGEGALGGRHRGDPLHHRAHPVRGGHGGSRHRPESDLASWFTGPASVRLNGTTVASALAVVMLVPTAVALWPNVPLTTRAVVLPRWYAEVGAEPPSGQVVLSYPASLLGSAVVPGLAGGQPDALRPRPEAAVPRASVGRAGRARAGFEVLVQASLPLGPPPAPSRSNLTAIREALDVWGVTTIVVPDEPELPLYDAGTQHRLRRRPPHRGHGPATRLRPFGLGVVGRRPQGTAVLHQPDRIQRLRDRSCVQGVVPPGRPFLHRRIGGVIIRVKEEGGRRCRSEVRSTAPFQSGQLREDLGGEVGAGRLGGVDTVREAHHLPVDASQVKWPWVEVLVERHNGHDAGVPAATDSMI